MRLRKKVVLFGLTALAALSVFAVACSDDDDDDDGADAGTTSTADTGSGGEEAVTVKVEDNSFSEAETTVAVGGTVTWDWAGSSNPHSVIGTSDNATDLIESEEFTGSGTYEVTFDEAGTYEYECGIHGSSMSGTIVVE